MKHSSNAVLQNPFLMGKKKVDIHFNIRCFQIPKSSKTFSECEDAFFIDNPDEPKFIAVADGCGSSFAPKIMADNLTQSFPKYAKEIFRKDFKNWHHNAIKNWAEQTKAFAYNKLPSFVKFGLKDQYGASTFLGIQIHNKSFMSDISVINVGDTALFHLNHKKRLKRMIPQLKQFTGATSAISSREKKGFNFSLRQFQFHYLDTIILATDGVGDWILNHQEELETLLKIKNNGEFLDFVNAIRQENPKLDDDSTIIIIESVKLLHKQESYIPTEEWMKEYDRLENERLLEVINNSETTKVEETTEKEAEKIIEPKEVIEEQFDETRFKKKFSTVLKTSQEKKDKNLVVGMINKFSSEELNHFISLLKPLFYGNESTKGDR